MGVPARRQEKVKDAMPCKEIEVEKNVNERVAVELTLLLRLVKRRTRRAEGSTRGGKRRW